MISKAININQWYLDIMAIYLDKLVMEDVILIHSISNKFKFLLIQKSKETGNQKALSIGHFIVRNNLQKIKYNKNPHSQNLQNHYYKPTMITHCLAQLIKHQLH
jgi:hypothetical protein